MSDDEQQQQQQRQQQQEMRRQGMRYDDLAKIPSLLHIPFLYRRESLNDAIDSVFSSVRSVSTDDLEEAWADSKLYSKSDAAARGEKFMLLC